MSIIIITSMFVHGDAANNGALDPQDAGNPSEIHWRKHA